VSALPISSHEPEFHHCRPRTLRAKAMPEPRLARVQPMETTQRRRVDSRGQQAAVMDVPIHSACN
jgi:hypothetical protein